MEIFYDALQRPIEKPDDVPVGRRISGYALVIRDAAILTVVPTWNTLYELPGGGIDDGEEVASGVERECMEETGYNVAVDGNVVLHADEMNFYHAGEKKFYRSLVRVHPGTIRSDVPDSSKVNVHENEIAESGFTPLVELTKENCHPNFWPVIERAQKAEQTAEF